MNSISKLAVTFVLAAGVFSATVPNAEAATLRSAAMASAKSQKGAHYQYGNEGGYSKGYDCSGLTYWAFRQQGETIPRTAQSQYNKSTHIAVKNRQAGDLIFIRDGSRVFHVGIFTGVRGGKGYMINANTGAYRGRKVVEAPVTEYTAGSPAAVYGRF